MKIRIALAAMVAVLAAMAPGSAVAMEASVADARPSHVAPLDVDVEQGSGLAACPAGRVCLYEHYFLNEFQQPGRVLSTNQDIEWLGDYNFNDITSSYFNRSNTTVRLYRDAYFQGPSFDIAPGAFSNVPEGWNDTVSSVRFL